MELIDKFEKLITTGEQLEPKGGELFSGYNGELQTEYLIWRTQAINLMSQAGNIAEHSLKEIVSNDKSGYFYRSSASQILASLKGIKSIIEEDGIDYNGKSEILENIDNSICDKSFSADISRINLQDHS